MSFTSGVTGTHLERSNLWSKQLKDILQDELEAQKYVKWMSEFPDGTTFNIPSIGQASVQNVVEDQDISYEAMDTGNFTFTIDEYVGSATYITEMAKQDMYYGQELISSFIPKQHRAIMEYLETQIMKTPGPNAKSGGGQTAASTNSINGFEHRFIASGTNEVMALADFAKAKLSLKKANVPLSNLVAVVDPTVAYELETLTNIVNVSNNPQYEGIVNTGLTTGMRFVRSIYGFDVYESNYLDDANETIGALTTTAGKQNLFFSADASVSPIVGAWRQMPKVDSEYNKDKQREEYMTTARWATKLYRPENMVCVLSDTDQV